MEPQGLYDKYRVQKGPHGDDVPDCFVLQPTKDHHARVAILAYARSVKAENPKLAADLFIWLEKLEDEDDESTVGE